MGESTSNFQIKSGGSTLFFRKDENNLYQTMYNTENEESDLIDSRCFQLSVAGIESGHCSGITSAYTNFQGKVNTQNTSGEDSSTTINRFGGTEELFTLLNKLPQSLYTEVCMLFAQHFLTIYN